MFYTFHQNNSGGSWSSDPRVAKNVIVEADSAQQANQRAQQVGIYFNGCDMGVDCDCCGDRWSEQWSSDSGDPVPSIYSQPVAEHKKGWFDDQNFCKVYYANGLVETWDYVNDEEYPTCSVENSPNLKLR